MRQSQGTILGFEKHQSDELHSYPQSARISPPAHENPGDLEEHYREVFEREILKIRTETVWIQILQIQQSLSKKFLI
jgi:hypothetical protein